jgi:hypothetical protein
MKHGMIVIFSALLLSLPVTGMAGEKAKTALCTAKDVQHNIDMLRASVEEMQATHDSQRGMDMLHEHMAMIIDNQEITLGLLEQARTGSKQNGVACPKKRDHIKK